MKPNIVVLGDSNTTDEGVVATIFLRSGCRAQLTAATKA